ncbi:hypothetical protein ATI61_110237 [Archangium gephyra]|uniref:Lipoprotein n=1 Tax=Archangium gephyra TaxID=48 RepID=A0ABX9JUF7_9BACT|nr:hypothetical protein [Archangium gephyra]REG27230.1 hypothetical protein ATI61_110237 [Archangium gephyra]
MTRKLLLPLVLLLPACSLLPWFKRPVHAPPEEAARVEFPLELPKETRTTISGAVATAMQLAMDDFLPLDVKPHRGATPEEVCLYQRESYEVIASPAPHGAMFVRITLLPKVCEKGGPLLDVEATYAVDVAGRRILAVQR